jgi:eukaryotic-like serine/threonine-protein kinase
LSIRRDERIKFGDYELDSSSRTLFRSGLPVKIQPQPLRVLEVLLERPGQIVSRDELRSRVWGDSTFVEFDQGLNYSIRQIRLALRESAAKPAYIETLPKQGYKFIATVSSTTPLGLPEAGVPDQTISAPATPPAPRPPVPPSRRLMVWAASLLILLSLASYFFLRPRSGPMKYTQLTAFADSASSPSLSPDGRLLAFIRGPEPFLTSNDVYVKTLPNGEAHRVSNDRRMKYDLAFSPDGDEIAYTVLDGNVWKTYAIPTSGGEARLLLSDSAGLSWLSRGQILFSQTRKGLHMGVFTGTATRQDLREIYFPAHERSMAHYSFASPNRESALVIEMNERGDWGRCRLISLTRRHPARDIGPDGACGGAAWSPDGSWMYFTAVVEGGSHLWKQRFPAGQPEQLTFGPMEENGVAVDPGGRSLISSMGVRESTVWFHSQNGDRSLSSEGEIIATLSPPVFNAEGNVLYYLVRRPSSISGQELWRTEVNSGETEAVLPGIFMHQFDLSSDGREVVYRISGLKGKPEIWLAPADRSSPPKRIGAVWGASPHFGPHGKILFQTAEGNSSFLEQMSRDGSFRQRIAAYPISDLVSVSPGGRWAVVTAPLPGESQEAMLAIPTSGGSPIVVTRTSSLTAWSPDGKFFFVSVEPASERGPGRSLAIPLGPDEALPEFPVGGIKPFSGADAMPGAEEVKRALLAPSRDRTQFAYVNTAAHFNLYRIFLP